MHQRHAFQSCSCVKDKYYVILIDGKRFFDHDPLLQIDTLYQQSTQ